jgi:hypothetical protein
MHPSSMVQWIVQRILNAQCKKESLDGSVSIINALRSMVLADRTIANLLSHSQLVIVVRVPHAVVLMCKSTAAMSYANNTKNMM